jgi:hypothetical protein
MRRSQRHARQRRSTRDSLAAAATTSRRSAQSSRRPSRRSNAAKTQRPDQQKFVSLAKGRSAPCAINLGRVFQRCSTVVAPFCRLFPQFSRIFSEPCLFKNHVFQNFVQRRFAMPRSAATLARQQKTEPPPLTLRAHARCHLYCSACVIGNKSLWQSASIFRNTLYYSPCCGLTLSGTRLSRPVAQSAPSSPQKSSALFPLVLVPRSKPTGR